MVDDVMDRGRLEVVQDGHSDTAIGEYGKEIHGPTGRVAADKCYLVSRIYTCSLQQKPDFDDMTGKIAVAICLSLIIGKCREIPVALDGL